MERPLDDQLLVQAMRKRILDEINKREQQAAIVNNVYGGGGQPSQMHGVADQMTGMSEGEDPYDYFVDITRKDLPDINPATGKPLGWEKSVHRHRKKKVTESQKSPKGRRGGS